MAVYMFNDQVVIRVLMGMFTGTGSSTIGSLRKRPLIYYAQLVYMCIQSKV